MRPGKLDLIGGRWVPLVAVVRLKGIDLTGATFKAQVRPVRDVGGTPLADLGNAASAAAEGVYVTYGGTATVSAHIAAGRLTAIPSGMVGTDNLTLTMLNIRFNEATMEAMPYPDERGNNAVLEWDLHATIGGLKQVYFTGTFTVEAGATQ